MPNLNVPKGNDRFNIDNYKTFEELEMQVMSNSTPNTFLIEKFANKDFFLKNKQNIFDFGFNLLYFKPKSEFIKFLEFLGLTFDGFMSSLPKKEYDLFNKIISEKKE